MDHVRPTSSDTEYVLLGIDEQSLNLDATVDPDEVAGSRALQLMEKGYPWSREVYAEAVRRLLDAGARLVVIDLLFPRPRDGDDALAQVLRDYPGRVILGCSFEQSIGTSSTGVNQQLSAPTPILAGAADSVGFVNFIPQQHNRKIIRSLRPYATAEVFAGQQDLGDKPIPALSTAAALALGKEVPVNYDLRRFAYEKKGFFRAVPFYEIFVPALWKVNHKDGARFKDRVVLIGPTAEHFQDYHMTPLGRLAGPVIHLHSLSAIMKDAWLTEAGPLFGIISILAAGAAAFALIMLRRKSWILVVGLLAGGALWIGICALSFAFASFFPPIAPPLLAWLLCGFAGLAVDVSMERAERSRMRSMFERYVSKDVVKEMVEDEASFQKMLGRKEIVALFSDLQGFTADSEKLDPAELLDQLNAYFAEMVQAVFAQSGTLDKFMGDAIMATWGGIRPQSPEEDARRAVKTALEMKERLAVINADRDAAKLAPWNSGIGLSQGLAVFGNVGSHEKTELTAIGDSVNLASRIEGLTRVYGCGILVDERVARRAAGVCDFLPVDTVRVKGRKQPEQLFMPYRRPDPDWVRDYLDAREKYNRGNFAGAREIFARLAEEGLAPPLARRFLIRCDEFLRNPPAPGWEGVWDFYEK